MGVVLFHCYYVFLNFCFLCSARGICFTSIIFLEVKIEHPSNLEEYSKEQFFPALISILHLFNRPCCSSRSPSCLCNNLNMRPPPPHWKEDGGGREGGKKR